ncbi:aminotransferase class III-fold pyridoxal phosphate-dependent enzyme [Paenibacillus sp. FSL K6-3166]|uniref:aminotransferase family protein n=1 Tax=Paenibacillus sp. FSL K6-3166 TaxID=2921492 RepID=UPI000BA0CF54|nr:hypothetical protein CA598_20805 [Paenibacillus sp. VTT E-133291]
MKKILTKLEANSVWNGWKQMQVYLEKGLIIFERSEGGYYYDQKGKKYIDATSNLLSSNLGHNHPRIIQRVAKQLNQLDSCTLIYSTSKISIEYTHKLLSQIQGTFRHLFFTNSGSEATDTAIKMAKQYYFNKGQLQKNKIISLKGAYHGSTIAATAASGNEYDKRALGEEFSTFIQVKAPNNSNKPLNMTDEAWVDECIREMEDKIKSEQPETIAALLVEPVQLSNGVVVFADRYFQKLRSICDKYNILFMVDEVATGFGRTGTLFAYEEWGVQPDIVLMAKSMTNGLIPMGGVLVTGEIYDNFCGELNSTKEFSHGYTSSGHPLACAAGLATLECIVQESILDRVKEHEMQVFQSLKLLESFPLVQSVQGKGYMLGINFNPNLCTDDEFEWELGGVIEMLLKKKGLIPYYEGEGKVIIAPPLNSTIDQLMEIVEKIEKACRLVEQSLKLKEKSRRG